MTVQRQTPAEAGALHPWCLVWIDAREARVLTWSEDGAHTEELTSDVPIHRASTGHVRHDPSFRHGGGGGPQTAGDPRRQEYLNRFVEEVATHVPATHDVKVVGPGETHERLADHLRVFDRRHGLAREVADEASTRLTRPQLVAMLRDLVGVPARRRRMGGRRDLAAGSGRVYD